MYLKKSLVGILYGLTLIILGMGSASSGHVEFPPPGNYTLTGMFGTCSVTAGVSITDSTNGTLNSLSTCPSLAVTSLPNSIAKSNHTVTIFNLTVETSLSTCHGNLEGVLTLTANNVTRVVYDPSYSTLSGGIFGFGCTFGGHLDF